MHVHPPAGMMRQLALPLALPPPELGALLEDDSNAAAPGRRHDIGGRKTFARSLKE